jgi:hypothetical protein
LPALLEDVQTLKMLPEQEHKYHEADQFLLNQALELSRNGDIGGLSAWFTTCRFRPASAYRGELVEYVSKRGKGSFRMPLPAIVGETIGSPSIVT